MVIEIKPNIFEGKNFRDLNLLVQFCNDGGRYKLYVDISKVKGTDLYNRLDRDDKELLSQYFISAVTSQSSNSNIVDYSVTTTPQSDREFDLSEAKVFFNQPVVIVLENSLNDAYFINAIVENFDARGEVKRHLRNGWMKFDNAGGCTNVENCLKAKMAGYPYLPKPTNIYLRCFVILDSDRTGPLVPVEDKHKSLVRFLRANRFSYHILEKRTMENYMPDDVFSTLKDGKLDRWIDAYLSLEEIQKDYINISKGFSKKNEDGSSVQTREELEMHVQALYHNVSETNYDLLNQGLRLTNFKAEFPKKFSNNHKVHKHSLFERIQNSNANEFHEIVQKLDKLI